MEPQKTLLLVDDEERILRSLAMLFRGRYQLLTTTDPRQALDWVRQQTVHVVVSDQKMPQMRGAELLGRIRECSPHSMRILLTGYSELDAVVASVNEGEIFRFINKPWDAEELRQTVAQAADIALALHTTPPAADLPVAMSSSSEAILVIDDDAEVVRIVQELVGADLPVHWARSLDEALSLIQAHPVGVIVSELTVRHEPITGLLKVLKKQHPEIVTVVLTPFQDVSVFVGLINQGQVYRLLPKPMRRGPLGMNLMSALRHHRSLRAAPQLRVAHVVEQLREAQEIGVAQRVMGLLSRLRSAAAPG